MFWLAAILFGLNYCIYPLCVNLIAALRTDAHVSAIGSDSYQPAVSVIIAAYNEEKVIRTKLENTLALDYPRHLLQIIVVADGSDDRTHEIANGYAEHGIVALHQPERGGKSAAINRAVAEASGEILLLSDANNDFGADAVRQLVRHFFDPAVGAVTGAKHVYQDDERQATRGESAYWKYESSIKRAESRLGSISSADGEILAVRKDCFNPIPPGLINDDAAITFDVVKQGFRVLYEEKAKSFEKASIDLVDDFNVKVRMTAGGFQTLLVERTYLFPPRSGFALRFLLHKALRWLVPIFLIAIFVASLALADRPFYRWVLILQFVFYGVSVYGWRVRKARALAGYVYLPMYFSVMNLALLVGLYRFLFGRQQVQWQKAAR